MKIKVSRKNAARIKAELGNVPCHLADHRYRKWGEISEIASDAEQKMATAGLAKSRRKGAYVTAVSGARENLHLSPRSATKVRLKRGAKNWFLTGAWTTRVFSNGGFRKIGLTDHQMANVIAHATGQFEQH